MCSSSIAFEPRLFAILLRGAILNRTYGIHKKLLGVYISLFLLTISGPIYYGPRNSVREFDIKCYVAAKHQVLPYKYFMCWTQEFSYFMSGTCSGLCSMYLHNLHNWLS